VRRFVWLSWSRRSQGTKRSQVIDGRLFTELLPLLFEVVALIAVRHISW
jgi:hypothetical protein